MKTPAAPSSLSQREPSWSMDWFRQVHPTMAMPADLVEPLTFTARQSAALEPCKRTARHRWEDPMFAPAAAGGWPSFSAPGHRLVLSDSSHMEEMAERRRRTARPERFILRTPIT